MFSGKTTELMRRLKRYQIATNKCLVIKYANDVRYVMQVHFLIQNLYCKHLSFCALNRIEQFLGYIQTLIEFLEDFIVMSGACLFIQLFRQN